MKSISCYFLLLFIFIGSISAQEKFTDNIKPKLDSLTGVLKTTSNKNKKTEILFQLSKLLQEKEKFNEALALANQANKIGQELNDSLIIAKSNQYKAISYLYKSNYPNALRFFYEAIPVFEKNKLYHFSSVAYSNVGNIYINLDKDSSAIKAFKLALKNAKQIDNKNLLSRIYGNIADSYLNSNNIDSIKYYVNKGIEIDKKNNFRDLEATKYSILGIMYRNNKDFTNAKIYLNKAIKLSKDIFFETQISALSNLATLYYLENKIDSLTIYLKKTKDALETKPGYFYQKKITYENLSEVYNEDKNYKKAYEYLKLSKIYSDSLLTKEKSKQLIESDAKFKTAQKDKEIAQQKLQLEQEKSNRNKLIFGSLAVLLLSFVGFQYNNNRQKRKKLLAQTQLQKEQEVNELRTKFLGNIAHEIRTPLTLISGNLELAKENIKDKNKTLKNIDVALINSKKVVEDANEILELLKFEKNKTTIKLTTLQLNESLKRIFKSFASLAEMKSIQLQYKSNISEDLTSKIDVEKVEKILNNLVSNAVKYSPSNSQIIFDANLNSQNQLTIKVTDFGQGIHFNETEKIFERFYQSSQSNAVGGIGIGLSLAKEFAELLNGTLTVKSELGKGSTFIFSLPIETAIKLNPTQPSKEKPNTATDKRNREFLSNEKQEVLPVSLKDNKTKILIVEDNPEMASYLEEILSNNYQCDKAFDGLEALEKIKTGSYDLITSDIMMPRIDGFQLREKLNEEENLTNIPFILISAKTLEEDKIKGFNLGIDDYILKPFNKNELLARINNLLANKNARDKWASKHPEEIEVIDSSQKKLLDKIRTITEENISDENFKVPELASDVGYSQRQLTRLLKKYTGMSPVKFILEIRLQKAYSLLQNKAYFTLSEVRYEVGIPTSSYFNKKFKERFGINPGELLL
ncbi:MAG: hybrid sensor histidine kinase/response regulator transcription factor [Flavobacteriales bacterium]